MPSTLVVAARMVSAGVVVAVAMVSAPVLLVTVVTVQTKSAPHYKPVAVALLARSTWPFVPTVSLVSVVAALAPRMSPLV